VQRESFDFGALEEFFGGCGVGGGRFSEMVFRVRDMWERDRTGRDGREKSERYEQIQDSNWIRLVCRLIRFVFAVGRDLSDECRRTTFRRWFLRLGGIIIVSEACSDTYIAGVEGEVDVLRADDDVLTTDERVLVSDVTGMTNRQLPQPRKLRAFASLHSPRLMLDEIFLAPLDSDVPLRVKRPAVVVVFFSSFAFSSLCLTILVRRGLRGASADELGKSSDELAFDWCMRSRLLTRWMRCFDPSLLAPFSLRFRLAEDFVDAVDSLLLVVVRRVRLAPDDSDENFVVAVRGMLSIDDCDEAALERDFGD
jgi:hypothetical protein